jgi:hypothetical protein
VGGDFVLSAVVDGGVASEIAAATAELPKTCIAKVAEVVNPPLIAKLRAQVREGGDGSKHRRSTTLGGLWRTA